MSATAMPRPWAAGAAGALRALAPLGALGASAALYALAFAPVPGAGLAAWIALAPFFAAAALLTPLRAAALGLALGPALGLATCWWLPEMLQRYFGMAPLASFALALGSFLAFAGLHFALLGAWLASLARRGPVSPLLVALGFGACEWLRATLPVANPWALSAYSQIELAPIAQLADLVGPFGIGALLGGANALVAGALAPALRARRPLRAAAVFAALLAAVLGYGTLQLRRSFADGPELRVALIQGGVARADDGRARSAQESRDELEGYLALTRTALEAGKPQLVVWPEGAVDFSPFEATQRMLRLRDAQHALGVDLLLGAPRRDGEGKLHSAMVLLRAGLTAGVQDKLEPMPFSERGLARGGAIHLFAVAGLRLGTAICSEAMGPDFVRRVVDAGATVLVNPSNDYWFVAEAAARQQLAKARFRAIETRRPLVRVASTGISAFVDPHGALATASGFDRADWLLGTVRGASGTTLHQRAGAAIGPALLLLCAAGTLLRARDSFPSRHDGGSR